MYWGEGGGRKETGDIQNISFLFSPNFFSSCCCLNFQRLERRGESIKENLFQAVLSAKEMQLWKEKNFFFLSMRKFQSPRFKS